MTVIKLLTSARMGSSSSSVLDEAADVDGVDVGAFGAGGGGGNMRGS